MIVKILSKLWRIWYQNFKIILKAASFHKQYHSVSKLKSTTENHLFTFWIVGPNCCLRIKIFLVYGLSHRWSIDETLETVGHMWKEPLKALTFRFHTDYEVNKISAGIKLTLTRLFLNLLGFYSTSLWIFSCIHRYLET